MLRKICICISAIYCLACESTHTSNPTSLDAKEISNAKVDSAFQGIYSFIDSKMPVEKPKEEVQPNQVLLP